MTQTRGSQTVALGSRCRTCKITSMISFNSLFFIYLFKCFRNLNLKKTSQRLLKSMNCECDSEMDGLLAIITLPSPLTHHYLSSFTFAFAFAFAPLNVCMCIAFYHLIFLRRLEINYKNYGSYHRWWFSSCFNPRTFNGSDLTRISESNLIKTSENISFCTWS